MEFSISTRWNSNRHSSAKAMIDEILELGLNQVELGYTFPADFAVDIKKMVHDGQINVSSVHNYCPVPAIAGQGHPELFTFSDSDQRTRDAALIHTSNTIRFAAEVNATVVVVHCGNVEMKNLTEKLVSLCHKKQRLSNSFEKIKHSLFEQRRKKVVNQLTYLYDAIDKLIPLLAETGIRLGLENLPTWEAIPTEVECHRLIEDFGSKYLCYWHDIGHAQIRENLGFINHHRVLESMSSVLGGFHVHDVKSPATDHLLPPMGDIDFSNLARFAAMDILRVLEPSSRISGNKIKSAVDYLNRIWPD